MLWKFKDRNSAIYGSIHMCDIDPPSLPRPVADVIQRADRIVFEADIRGQPDLSKVIMPGGRQLSGLIGDALFQRFSALWLELLDDGPLLQTSFPAIAALFLMSNKAAEAGYLPQNGMDHQILDRAEAIGKKIRFFEDLDGQLELFARAPIVEQAKFLRYGVDQIEAGGNELRELVEGWKRDDIPFLTRFADERRAWFPVTYKTLLDDRNRSWIPSIEECLESGEPTLFVVGALHLVGDDSVPSLLMDRGHHLFEHATPLA